MSKLTLLTEEQIYGKNKLNLFKVIEPSAKITDYAIIKGGITTDSNANWENRNGYYYLQNKEASGGVKAINAEGEVIRFHSYRRDGSIRICLHYAEAKKRILETSENKNGILKIKYGYYPGQVVEKEMQEILLNLFRKGKLKKLDHVCTTDYISYDDYNKAFIPEVQTYYEYNKDIYVWTRANSHYRYFTLSNKERYKNNDFMWVKVEPITWLKHPKDGLMVTENCILSGIRYQKKHKLYDNNFSDTELKWFLDNFLYNDISYIPNIDGITTNYVDEENNFKLNKNKYLK